jgi:hypothetical protein
MLLLPRAARFKVVAAERKTQEKVLLAVGGRRGRLGEQEGGSLDGFLAHLESWLSPHSTLELVLWPLASSEACTPGLALFTPCPFLP